MSILKLLEMSVNNLLNFQEDFDGSVQASNKKVRIFNGENYTGLTKDLYVGDYTFSMLESMEGSYTEDDIRSIQIDPGLTVELYKNDNFTEINKEFNMAHEQTNVSYIDGIVKSIKVKGIPEKFTDASPVEQVEPVTSSDLETHRENIKNDVLFKYKEYIDIDNLKNDVHSKNDVVINDLSKKTKQQEKNIKKLKEENAKIIKVSKEFEASNKINENLSNKYKRYCIITGILLIIIITLLVFKYKKLNILQ